MSTIHILVDVGFRLNRHCRPFRALVQGLKHAARGPHVDRESTFVRPAMLFGNFEIINI